MKILALEFSTERRSVAVLDSTAGPAEVSGLVETEAGERSTRVCALVEAALGRAGLGREAVDRLAVGLGPGSYAGIRVAIAFALGWQLARDIPLVGVSSVESLAARLQAEGERGRVSVVVDAQRGEFYLAGYALERAGWGETEALRLASGAEIETRFREGVNLVGPDLARHFPGGRTRFPDAVMVACLAAQRPALLPGESLEPICLRPVSFVKAPPPRTTGLALDGR